MAVSVGPSFPGGRHSPALFPCLALPLRGVSVPASSLPYWFHLPEAPAANLSLRLLLCALGPLFPCRRWAQRLAGPPRAGWPSPPWSPLPPALLSNSLAKTLFPDKVTLQVSSACEFEGAPQPSQHSILILCSGPFVSPHGSPGAIIPVCTGPSSTPSGPPSPSSKAPALTWPALPCCPSPPSVLCSSCCLATLRTLQDSRLSCCQSL